MNATPGVLFKKCFFFYICIYHTVWVLKKLERKKNVQREWKDGREPPWEQRGLSVTLAFPIGFSGLIVTQVFTQTRSILCVIHVDFMMIKPLCGCFKVCFVSLWCMINLAASVSESSLKGNDSELSEEKILFKEWRGSSVHAHWFIVICHSNLIIRFLLCLCYGYFF